MRRRLRDAILTLLTEISVEVCPSTVAPEPPCPQLQALPTVSTGQGPAGLQVLLLLQAGPGPCQDGGLALLPPPELELPAAPSPTNTARPLLCLSQVTPLALEILSTAIEASWNKYNTLQDIIGCQATG